MRQDRRVESPLAYIPVDRLHALAGGADLPDRASGAALFADISGFTPLADALVREFKPGPGAEELTNVLNLVYGALIDEVHRHRGSVVGFSGDAITCWFDGDEGLRAATSAMAMQQVMGQLEYQVRARTPVSLAIKVTVSAGPVRRFLVGDPQIQVIDVLAGATLERAVEAQQYAGQGEVVVGAEVAAALSDRAETGSWRSGEETGAVGGPGRYAVIGALGGPARAAPWHALQPAQTDTERPLAGLAEEQVRPWLLPPVWKRLRQEEGRFLAELRPAVALFVGFDGPDYDRDDAAGEKLDRYVRWVQGVLGRYESYLLQLTCGDKGNYLYAAFGSPLAHGDDPVRAVTAAIELQSPPADMDFVGAVRIGISQGRMRAGAYGSPRRRTYGVLGDEVNVAARLMEEAGAGQIVVSQRIAETAGRWHHFELLGATQIKGKTAPLPLHTVAIGRLPSRQRPATMFPNLLVGREDELARMEQLLEAVLAREGRILRLVGAAGVGKSHLAAEFVERAIGRGLQVIVGACHSTTQGIIYAPWRQAFRALLDLSEEAIGGEDPRSLADRQIAQLRETIQRTNPSWLPRLPLLGDLLGLPIPDNETTAAFDPRLRQESLLALAVEMMQAWASERPLVLLVEDVHWMDEASLALTTALSRAVGRSAVLLILIHRPPDTEDGPLLPDLDRLPCYELIDLGKLSPQGIRDLVTHRLGGKASPLAMALIEKLAQGNPFFAEELVDALGEEGGLEPDHDGSWSLSESILTALREANCLTRKEGRWLLAQEAQVSTVALGIPDSVQGLVLSRIDRLPEPHKLTIKVAGVVGRSFGFDLLTGSHPARPGRETLLEQMEMLQALDFIRLELPDPQRSYLFKHNITQEVVYQTLLEDQRSELHRGIGEALEQLSPGAIGRLAYHYSRSGVRDKALHYLRRAGEQAAARYANAEAADYFSRALDLLSETDLFGRYEVLLAREKVLDLQGRRGAQQQDLAALQALVDTLQDDRRRAEVGLRQAHYAEVTGDYAAAVALAGDAVRLAQASQEGGTETSALQADGFVQGGLALFRQSEYAAAQSQLEQALALARAARLTTMEATVLRNLGNIATRRGDYDRARSCYEQALALHRAAGDIRGEGLVLNNLGIVVMEQGDYAGGLACCQQSLDRCREVGDRRGACMALGNLGNANHSLGNYAQARSFYHQALEWSREIGDRYNEAMAKGNLGVLFFEQGDCSAARTAFEQHLSFDREVGDQRGEAICLSNLGDVVQVQGHYERARAYYDQALSIYRRIGAQWGECTTLSRLCRVLLYLEDGEAARDCARRSVGIARDLGDQPGEAAAWKNLGGVLAGLRRWEEAAAAYERALDLQRALGEHNLACESLAGLATVALALGDPAGAKNRVEEILAHLQTGQLYGAEEPFRVYWTCCQTLQAVGDPRAEEVLTAAHRLLQEWAARIGDEEDRRSFLERVTINKKIVEAFATL